MGGVGSGLCDAVGEGGGLSSCTEMAKSLYVVTVKSCMIHNLNELIVSFQKIIRLRLYWTNYKLKLWPFKDASFNTAWANVPQNSSTRN